MFAIGNSDTINGGWASGLDNVAEAGGFRRDNIEKLAMLATLH